MGSCFTPNSPERPPYEKIPFESMHGVLNIFDPKFTQFLSGMKKQKARKHNIMRYIDYLQKIINFLNEEERNYLEELMKNYQLSKEFSLVINSLEKMDGSDKEEEKEELNVHMESEKPSFEDISFINYEYDSLINKFCKILNIDGGNSKCIISKLNPFCIPLSRGVQNTPNSPRPKQELMFLRDIGEINIQPIPNCRMVIPKETNLCETNIFLIHTPTLKTKFSVRKRIYQRMTGVLEQRKDNSERFAKLEISLESMVSHYYEEYLVPLQMGIEETNDHVSIQVLCEYLGIGVLEYIRGGGVTIQLLLSWFSQIVDVLCFSSTLGIYPVNLGTSVLFVLNHRIKVISFSGYTMLNTLLNASIVVDQLLHTFNVLCQEAELDGSIFESLGEELGDKPLEELKIRLTEYGSIRAIMKEHLRDKEEKAEKSVRGSCKTTGEAIISFYKGFESYKNGDYERGIKYLELPIYTLDNLPIYTRDRIRASIWMTECLLETREDEKALNLLENNFQYLDDFYRYQCLTSAFHSLQQDPLAIHILYKLGVIKARLGDVLRANIYLDRALYITTEINGEYNKWTPVILFKKAQLSSCIVEKRKYLLKAERISRIIQSNFSYMSLQIAQYGILLQEHRLGENILTRCLEDLESNYNYSTLIFGPGPGTGSGSNTLGSLYTNSRYSSTMSEKGKISMILYEISYLEEKCYILNCLAMNYMNEFRYAEASRYLDDAFSTVKMLENIFTLHKKPNPEIKAQIVQIFLYQGIAEEKLGKIGGANEYFQQVELLVEQGYGNRMKYMGAMAKGKLFKLTGHVDLAVQVFQETLETVKREGASLFKYSYNYEYEYNKYHQLFILKDLFELLLYNYPTSSHLLKLGHQIWKFYFYYLGKDNMYLIFSWLWDGDGDKEKRWLEAYESIFDSIIHSNGIRHQEKKLERRDGV